MTRLKTLLWFVLFLVLLAGPAASARPMFITSEIEGAGAEIVFCDLDGDRLKDAVLVDGLELSIFFQDAKSGFSRQPQQHYRLDDRPAMIWSARLGKKSESLLVMTSAGVTELSFTNRTDPLVRTQIIQQPTIIPDTMDEAPVMHFSLSADTGTDWPLLLVPVGGGLQVWQHADVWRQSQVIERSVDAPIRASVGATPGYSRSFALSLSLGDVNGDGRNDLMVRQELAGGKQTHNLYLQQTNGTFTAPPALTYTNQADRNTALCWVDINRDGRVDLLKGTLLDDPSFLPGLKSGKVLVGAFLADAQGRIPAEPQQVFRKNDWSPGLPAVDVDGDGFMDLVLGYVPLNTREGFRKMVTAEQIDFSLKFSFYRPGPGFPKEPDFQRDLLIHFDHVLFSSSDRGQYFEQFVNLSGDFNGDGKKDLLVRERSDAVSVYFFDSREKGFSSKADLRFSFPGPIDWCELNDLNGDGASDLIVKLQKRNGYRICTSQGK